MNLDKFNFELLRRTRGVTRAPKVRFMKSNGKIYAKIYIPIEILSKINIKLRSIIDIYVDVIQRVIMIKSSTDNNGYMVIPTGKYGTSGSLTFSWKKEKMLIPKDYEVTTRKYHIAGDALLLFLDEHPDPDHKVVPE